MSRRPKPVHTVESDDDYDEIKTVELNPVDEINAVAARKFPHVNFRLLLCLSSAPEEFQRRQHQVIEGLPGVLSIHDDILVYGEGDTYADAHQDHDRKLKKTS